jgi:4-carboxymuconolactone decarboxylase
MQGMAKSDSHARESIRSVVPKLAELSDNVLYGDVWERPGLSKRDRSLVTIAALLALHRPDQLRSHFVRGLKNGVTWAELEEMIVHLAFYAGWPNAMVAAQIVKDLAPAAEDPSSR